MKPLFYATLNYAYSASWTKGKDYPVFKIEMATEMESNVDGYGSQKLSSCSSYFFLTVNDNNMFTTMNCNNFDYKTKLDKVLK